MLPLAPRYKVFFYTLLSILACSRYSSLAQDIAISEEAETSDTQPKKLKKKSKAKSQAASSNSKFIDTMIAYYNKELGIAFISLGSRHGIQEGARICLLKGKNKLFSCTTIFDLTDASAQARFNSEPQEGTKVRIFKTQETKKLSNLQISYSKDLGPSLLMRAPRYLAASNTVVDPWQTRPITVDDYGQITMLISQSITSRTLLRSGIAWHYLQGREERFDLPQVFNDKDAFGINRHRFDSLRPFLEVAYIWRGESLSLLAGIGQEVSYLNYSYEFSAQQGIDNRQLLARNQIYHTQLLSRATIGLGFNAKPWIINLELTGLIAGRTLSYAQTSYLETQGNILPGFSDSEDVFKQKFVLQNKKKSARLSLGLGIQL